MLAGCAAAAWRCAAFIAFALLTPPLGAQGLPAAQPGAGLRGEAGEERFPFRQQPVDYFSDLANEPVARLKEKLEAGNATLDDDAQTGFLPALLRALDVPAWSQMLVFSKTSVNAALIGPDRPRALYFNDQVYVGYVPGAKALEIAAMDPLKGALFYTLSRDEAGRPRLRREENCLTCHASSNTLHVPGLVLKSFVTDARGEPRHGLSRVTSATPFADRWGGWYVTGQFEDLAHLGNLVSGQQPARGEPGRTLAPGGQFRKEQYLSAESDIVALLVHDHQTHLHNLLTRAGFAQLFGRDDASETELLRGLLMADEAPLTNPVLGSSAFEAQFSQRGPRDARGRSLRQFDLESRTFRYRLSYLIYSPAFNALPPALKDRLYLRLWRVLTGGDEAREFPHLGPQERRGILEILRDTKPGLPEYWQRDRR
jgi:hypothetical protein